MSLASILVIGLLLGMRHATEADHVAAVASLAARSRTMGHTIRLGVAWGAGHTITLLACGGAVLVLGFAIPGEAAQAFEVAVGAMLVGLGADLLFRARRDDVRTRAIPPRFPARAVLVGMMHGMAGSAAIMLLSLGVVESSASRMVYIAVFGIGSMLGMALLSAVIALPLKRSSGVLNRTHAAFSLFIGLTTIVTGLYLLFQQLTGASL